jgi:hypothetical protein
VNKKGILLFIGLLLPVLVFLFLKFFGRNEFDVPLIFERPIVAPPGCNRSYSHPYILEDSIVNILGRRSKLVLITFGNEQQLERAVTKIDTVDLRLVSVHDLKLSEEQIGYLRECVLLLGSEKDVALIDARKQLRGQYESDDREDLDRMVAEINILLKRY